MVFDIERLGSSCHSRNTEHTPGALRVLGPVLPVTPEGARSTGLRPAEDVSCSQTDVRPDGPRVLL